MKFISEEERRRRVDALMHGVEATSVRNVERPVVNQLDQASLKVLTKFGLEPGTHLLEAYSALGLHPAEGKAAIDDLLARGFVKLHRLVRKGRGGQPTVVELLPAGKEELAKRGITLAEKKLKRGGFKHDVYGRYLEKWAKAQAFRYWFERTLGRKAFDFVHEDVDGNLRGIEICLTGSVEWTAQQTIKAAEVEGVVQVVVACEQKAFLKAIMEEVRKIDALGLYRKKIEGKSLAEFVT